jgi:hypothetical protein
MADFGVALAVAEAAELVFWLSQEAEVKSKQNSMAKE